MQWPMDGRNQGSRTHPSCSRCSRNEFCCTWVGQCRVRALNPPSGVGPRRGENEDEVFYLPSRVYEYRFAVCAFRTTCTPSTYRSRRHLPYYYLSYGDILSNSNSSRSTIWDPHLYPVGRGLSYRRRRALEAYRRTLELPRGICALVCCRSIVGVVARTQSVGLPPDNSGRRTLLQSDELPFLRSPGFPSVEIRRWPALAVGDGRRLARQPGRRATRRASAGAGLSAVVVEGRGKTEASLHRSVCRIRARQK